MVSTPRTTAFDEILPLDTIAKLLDFEQCLEREENRSNFVSVIQSIGGKSLNDVVVRCMEEIVSDCVAKDINWEGELRKGVQKHSFSKSKIKTVLFGKCPYRPISSPTVIVQSFIFSQIH